jgi:hypothetical protein
LNRLGNGKPLAAWAKGERSGPLTMPERWTALIGPNEEYLSSDRLRIRPGCCGAQSLQRYLAHPRVSFGSTCDATIGRETHGTAGSIDKLTFI